MKAGERIIVALDVDSVEKATNLIQQLAGYVGYFKIGLEFILHLLFEGKWLEFKKFFDKKRGECEKQGLIPPGIMFDIKLHDIPNTMAGAIKQIAAQGLDLVTIHASAGPFAMMEAMKNRGETRVLAVTVLTSLGDDDTKEIYGSPSMEKVIAFLGQAKDSGVCSVVCSPKETKAIRGDERFDFIDVFNPGIRPSWSVAGDQKRISSPRDAVKNGADYLVIGRSITQPPEEVGSPIDAVNMITAEIEESQKGKGGTK